MAEGKQVVLCVDDDPDARFVVRTQLEAGGYEVVEAEDGATAIAAFESAKPDVVIVDLMMEEVDAGLSLVRELQSRGNIAPTFVLSSQGDNLAGMTDLAPLNVAGVLQKPVETNVLLSVVAAKLGQTP